MTGEHLERAAEVALLGAVAWPAIGACASRDFWRSFPGLARRLAILLAVYGACLAALAAAAPTWSLRGLAGLGVAVLIAVHVYSASGHGRRRGWPAGSLRPLALAPWFRQEYFLDQHTQFGSPFKTSQFLKPTACLVGLPGGLDFFRDHDVSLASPPWAFGRFIPGGFLRHMPRDSHVVVKDVFRKAMAREVYEPLAPFMREVFDAALLQMAAESRDAGVPPRRHLQRAVFQIWARLFFGIEPDRDDFAHLKALYKVIDIRNPSGASDRVIHDAVDEIGRLALRSLMAAPTTPTGVPRSFLEAMEAGRAGSANHPTLRGNLVYMMHTTWADVSGLLQWLLRMLTDHPEWVQRVRQATPARAAAANEVPLSTRIVMETLRLEQSEYLYRVATRTITEGDVVIPRGWLVRLCVRESHRDATVFENPSAFDPDRFLGRAFTRREYAPFGAGLRHACLGESLTRMVGSIFVESLATGYEWRTVVEAPPEHSAWRHWRPGSGWRVAVRSRA